MAGQNRQGYTSTSLEGTLAIPGFDREFPLVKNGQRIAIGLLEVGIKAKHKRHQINSKQRLVNQHWDKMIHSNEPIGWQPDIYRIVGSYEKGGQPTKNIPDIMVWYKSIDPKDLESITKKELEKILEPLKKKKYRYLRENLRELIVESRTSELYDEFGFITTGNEHTDKLYGIARGRCAEILALKAFRPAVTSDIEMFDNGHLKLVGGRYKRGTEIDALLVFYGNRPPINLANNLRRNNTLRVIDTF